METPTPRQEGERAAIEVRNISKVYASQDGPVEALSDVSFAMADAEFVTIVGHSGCGKTTLLKIIAGLLGSSSGTVTVRGRRGPYRGIRVCVHPRALAELFRFVARRIDLRLRQSLAATIANALRGEDLHHIRTVCDDLADEQPDLIGGTGILGNRFDRRKQPRSGQHPSAYRGTHREIDP